jgi:hypothetical protein
VSGPAALLDRVFADVGAEGLFDVHAHLVGLGAGGTGCRVNPSMRSFLHPVRRTVFSFLARAAGVRDLDAADADYVNRLRALVAEFPVPRRTLLLAFDAFHRPDGAVCGRRTEFFVPNDFALRLAKEHPDMFLPGVSVHPYRPDAVRELARCRERGARFVKWLPNAQGMDPADPACDPFYDALRERCMVLLCHTGKERAVRETAGEEPGNPLRLRRPLDRGVRVVMAHCANLGRSRDLDRKGAPLAPSFDLLLRVLDDPRYRRLAFADISAITLAERLPRPLATILDRPDLHDRLVDGSDYPIPGVRPALRLGPLVRHGFLATEDARELAALRPGNPLLFDYAVKRLLRHPRTGARFPARLFAPPAGLLDALPAHAEGSS